MCVAPASATFKPENRGWAIPIFIPLPLPYSTPFTASLSPFQPLPRGLQAGVRGVTPENYLKFYLAAGEFQYTEICQIRFLSTLSTGHRITKNNRLTHLVKMPGVGG